MSALGGIYDFTGAPVQRDFLGTLECRLARLGPDGGSHYVSNSIGMVYCPFYTTAESHLETQPVVDQGLIATFDGRLDNRQSLISLLELPLTDTTDTGLALASYKKWGRDCFPRFVGDFAVALWDSQARTLVLSRDPFGVKPLFYFIDACRVIWASCIETLLHFPQVPKDINESFLALYLASETDGSTTPFRAITPVEPGHIVSIKDGRANSESFWAVDSRSKEIYYRSDRDYEEHFIQLFSDAVRACLRADRPVMAQLSGGLDSSSIVCTADAIMPRGNEHENGRTGRVSTVSFVFDKARQSDERDFIKIVEGQRQREGIHLLEDQDPILASQPDDAFISFPSPIFCFGGRLKHLLAAMNSVGARILLSGWCGDHLLAPEDPLPLELGDMFRRCKISRLIREAVQWSIIDRRSVFQLIWRAAIKPNLPGHLSCTTAPLPAWIDRKFAARTGLTEDSRATNDACVRCDMPSKSARLRAIKLGIGAIASGYVSYQTTLGCLEMRFPFLNVPLVEYLLSIPVNQLMRPAERRSIQRRSLRGVLPEAVRLRTDKRGPDEAVLLAFNRNWPYLMSLVTSSRACARGYVEQAKLHAELTRARHGYSTSIQALLRFISLEMWLRNVEHWGRSFSGTSHLTRPSSRLSEA